MASLKIKYRHSSIEGKAGTLFYQVIHNRVARQINSGYKIYPDEWDIFNSQIIIPAKTGENRHRYLVSLKKCIEEDTSRLKDIMIRFENLGYKYTADEIIEYYSAPPVNEYFVSFCENLIEELRQIGKIRTTETYTTTLNSFKRFMNFRKKGRDIPFDNIDSNLMMEYEQYLKSNDICPNSTSYYMRNLRAMYNRAVEKELVIQRYPFKRKYSINSLVYWVTYVHNVVYSFYRSMIYCYINSTQRCAGSIVIDIIPTNGADKRKFFPFAPYFPVTNVIKRYFYPYFPAIIGIKGYSFPYFPYLSGIMKIKTALYSLFSRLDWHKTVVFPCLGEIYEGIRSLSWEIPVT